VPRLPRRQMRRCLSLALVLAFASLAGAAHEDRLAPGERPPLLLTVLYDNYPFRPGLRTAWGFSCLVELGEEVILFDTGGSAGILLSNMRALGIEPDRIQKVALSHIHGDHVGGLLGFLEKNSAVTVYLPASFPEGFKDRVRCCGARVVEVRGPMEIGEGVYSTGEMGTRIREQALVVESSEGLVVITGCAHPGIVEVVRRAVEIGEEKVHLVVGGFHMAGMPEARVRAVVQAFRELGVARVAPCHCSGDLARRLFREAWGGGFHPAGVGWSFGLPSAP